MKYETTDQDFSFYFLIFIAVCVRQYLFVKKSIQINLTSTHNMASLVANDPNFG